MTSRRIAGINAVLFFCFWLFILYAGADHPPPPGFILIVLLVLVCALLVYWRVPIYIEWHIARQKHRWYRVLRDGVVTGLVIALLVMILPGGGEPSVTPQMIDRLIWFSILGIMGAINTVAIYLVNAFIASRFLSSQSG